jgi:ethanolamine ammonia-lyase small subunit
LESGKENLERAFSRLCRETPARLRTGHAGSRLPTREFLRLLADHAVAVDAVFSEADLGFLAKLGFETVQTLVSSKEEYIKRPDLGRRFSKETLAFMRKKCILSPDVQIVAADGLSATAIAHQLEDTFEVIADFVTQEGFSLGTPLFVRYGRVGAMDEISESLAAKATVMLIGEPGLRSGQYGMLYGLGASKEKPESQRT